MEQSNSWADEFDKEGGDGKTREREKAHPHGDSHLGDVRVLLAATTASHQCRRRLVAERCELEIHSLHLVVLPWFGDDALYGEPNRVFSEECAIPRRIPLFLAVLTLRSLLGV